MEKYWKQFDRCLQNEKPFCQNRCPFHLDVFDFQAKMARNNYNAAYKTFRNAVSFPDIAAALCPEYCAAVCPRGETDQAVQLSLLEKTCVAKATKKEPTDYNVPKKDGKIAVIGGGTSGLACALRLAQKKYDVTIYEKTDRLGGKLWELLPPEVFLADIERQFRHETYALHLSTEVTGICELRGQAFDAIYIATGENGNDFGVSDGKNGRCALDGKTALFAGGSLAGKDPMHAMADGLDMAWAIELYLKTGKLEYPALWEPCRIETDPSRLIKSEAILPTDGGLFTDEEAKAEAERCMRCQCDGCMVYCDLYAYHKKWPLKVREELMCTLSASESMGHRTPARRLINTCTQCGLCDEVCTGKIELAEMMLDARRKLHKLDKMPGGYHQFWIRDMEFANGAEAAIIKKAPGQEACEYAFFPGCQLGASDPRYVTESYRWLLSQKPDTALMLYCCGVPAEWAGNEKMHKKEIENLRKEWKKLGEPTLILACPACGRHFTQYLPEIRTISFYEILEQGGAEPQIRLNGESWSVFDPCTARHNKPLEEAVRKLAAKSGAALKELPGGHKHGCCGYGGHVSTANRDYADTIAKKRISLSESPYIAYCINCRDILAGFGKPVLHILDLLFGIRQSDAKLPTVTERRRNRVRLKEMLLSEIWGETMEKKPEQETLKLVISPEIAELMDRQKLLEEDVESVIRQSEATKRRTYRSEKGTYLCYREIGNITCWVEYRPAGDRFEVVNVYTHRMKMVLEEVWNGRKTDPDLR